VRSYASERTDVSRKQDGSMSRMDALVQNVYLKGFFLERWVCNAVILRGSSYKLKVEKEQCLNPEIYCRVPFCEVRKGLRTEGFTSKSPPNHLQITSKSPPNNLQMARFRSVARLQPPRRQWQIAAKPLPRGNRAVWQSSRVQIGGK
jgi:hypothetical protein